MLEALAVLLAFITGAALGPLWLEYQRRRGLVSIDVYKNRSGVPKAGGLIAVISGLVGLGILSFFDIKLAYVAVLAAIVGLVGLLDDVYDISEAIRVAVPLVAAILLYFIVKLRMTLPFMGTFYSPSWLAVLSIPIMTNAYNMLDPVNGFLPLSNAIIGAALSVSAFLKGDVQASYAFAVHVAASLALFLYNRYPARTFNGNVGSYFLGAEIATLAAVYDMVPQLVFASMPYIVNGILIIFSARGIRGRNKIARPTLLINGKVQQNCDSNIISLVRLLVGDGPMSEYEIFKGLTYLTVITSILSVAL
ncbi:MAG: UDP-N-acetylglucosamine--dolichyl-phosphate N-acetylglucosaminephosphotransferase [Thermoproteus sp.]